jgi:hypothetical protein
VTTTPSSGGSIAFARTARWTPLRIDLLGTDPIDDQQTFVSDHFGLEVELAIDR